MPGDGAEAVPALPIIYDGSDYDARFRWELALRGDTAVMSVIGRAMQSVGDDFTAKVAQVLPVLQTRRLLIDFTDCEQIASAALGYLVRLFREATALGFQVIGLCPDPNLRTVMDVLGVSDFLLFVEDEATGESFFEAQGL